MQKGFIALPILAIIILGMTVVGGGSYTVYKVNQIQQESSNAVSELEQKIEQMASTTAVVESIEEAIKQATTTGEIASSTERVINTEVRSTPNIQPIVAPVVQKTPSVTPIDVCLNIAGLQDVAPDGYKLSGNTCIKLEDKCFNIDGMQDVIPSGMLVFKGYGCLTERDMEKIEEVEREQKQAEKEINDLNEKCDELKVQVYSYDTQILDVRQDYIKKISDYKTNPGNRGVAREFNDDGISALESQMYDELDSIALDRNRVVNEHNYLCVN